MRCSSWRGVKKVGHSSLESRAEQKSYLKFFFNVLAFSFFLKIFMYLFGPVGSSLWHMGSWTFPSGTQALHFGLWASL